MHARAGTIAVRPICCGDGQTVCLGGVLTVVDLPAVWSTKAVRRTAALTVLKEVIALYHNPRQAGPGPAP